MCECPSHRLTQNQRTNLGVIHAYLFCFLVSAKPEDRNHVENLRNECSHHEGIRDNGSDVGYLFVELPPVTVQPTTCAPRSVRGKITIRRGSNVPLIEVLTSSREMI